MKRQIFFRQVGGYDLHSGRQLRRQQPDKVMIGAQCQPDGGIKPVPWLSFQRSDGNSSNRFTPVSRQVTRVDDLQRILGRTFSGPTASAAITAGAVITIIMGGGVKGDKPTGNFPRSPSGAPGTTPAPAAGFRHAIDQYFATIATSFGVDSGNLGTVFPNIGRFATPDLGFMEKHPDMKKFWGRS